MGNIYNEENLGYSKGNNIGLKRVRTQYIGLLNNDILLSPSWLENTISIFEKGKKVENGTEPFPYYFH